MNLLLAQWNLWDEQLAEVDEKISERARSSDTREIISNAALLATVPGISVYSGLALASRIGPIARFLSPRSLANYLPDARLVAARATAIIVSGRSPRQEAAWPASCSARR